MTRVVKPGSMAVLVVGLRNGLATVDARRPPPDWMNLVASRIEDMERYQKHLEDKLAEMMKPARPFDPELLHCLRCLAGSPGAKMVLKPEEAAEILDGLRSTGETEAAQTDRYEALIPPGYKNCPACGTKTIYAPGIGPYCPNKVCDRADNLQPGAK